MIVDLTNTEDLPKAFDLVLRPDEVDLEDELAELNGDVRAAVTVNKSNSGILAEGRISAAVKLHCGRCLNETENFLEIPFSVRFVDAGSLAGGGDLEVSPAELDVSVFENDRLDLNELVREQILLSLPAQFICRETCKGLCRICGGDRNLIDCKCEDGQTDPRWSALKSIKF